MDNNVNSSPKTLTDLLRGAFKGVVIPIARFLNKIGLTPNMVTLLGLVGQVIASYFLAIGQISLGGVLLVLFAPLDFLDGSMARLRGTPTQFGAFFDSVTDRYAELSLFGGLLIYFSQHQDWLACILAYLAAAGSIMVSYTRARAEGVGYEAKIGLLSRVERYFILVPLLIFNQPLWAIAILAFFTNLTAVQRIMHVYRQAGKEVNHQA